MRRIAAEFIAFAALLGLTWADVYMHNPRGSNDRNCERNVNRNNGNRLFDSQNNAKGGYACPRRVGGPEAEVPDPNFPESYMNKMFYYSGSRLPIEWTNQHGCGSNPKEHCEGECGTWLVQQATVLTVSWRASGVAIRL